VVAVVGQLALVQAPAVPAGAQAAGTVAAGGAADRAADRVTSQATSRAREAPGAAALLPTPLLSPARVPRVLQALYAQDNLAARLSATMSPAVLGLAASRSSCAEVAQSGMVVYEDHAGLPVLPASNMKLLTATALLDRLGASYTFRTEVMVAGRPVDGVVNGDLYLIGGGDPLLRLPSFAAGVPGGGTVYTDVDSLVARVKAAGVEEVTGSVVGDASRYDSLQSVPGWPERYSYEGDVGALSALGIDDGFALAGAPVPESASPATQSAGVVTKLLRSSGVEVDGPATSGTAPAGARLLAQVVSPPLGEILGEVLRESDNTAMELLTKELGFRESGTGSTRAGVAAVRADLAADGLPLGGFVNVDGSGLSPEDRVTCALLMAALERAGPEGLLVRDLPVAGVSGTLAKRLVGTPAAGRVHAKTGTLYGVSALSGWAEAKSGQGGGNPALASPVAFAVVLNDLAPSLPVPHEVPDDLTDRAAVQVAAYPSAPALARFEP
jgi:D-alanyl-D-alanine carboxypeptidase/D-alanyl-D-alanine-endopeptidase (penicillin-binding protein 4)